MRFYTGGLPLILSAVLQSSIVRGTPSANIYEDSLAFPQYEITFSEVPLTPSEAESLISNPSPQHTYHTLRFSSRPFLCSIPTPTSPPANETERSLTRSAEAAEASRIVARGTELIDEALKGKCIYFTADWWSYSFCYPKELRQYHAATVPPGKPSWPPREDPEGVTYVLGRNKAGKKDGKKRELSLQTNGETRYLVEKWTGGTICDLTGRPRTVEVQWYCGKEGAGERIGSVREVAICVYAITIFSEKLCQEKAFVQPEKGKVGEKILCSEVMSKERIEEWERMLAREKRRVLELEEKAKRDVEAAEEIQARVRMVKQGGGSGGLKDPPGLAFEFVEVIDLPDEGDDGFHDEL